MGAFKIRCGLRYFDQLAQRSGPPREMVSATRGNHGQSTDRTARRHGVACTIVVPRGNSVERTQPTRTLGVTLIEHGEDFQAARERAMQIATERGAPMVPSYHPDLVYGVAPYWWEFLRAAPQLDVACVPSDRLGRLRRDCRQTSAGPQRAHRRRGKPPCHHPRRFNSGWPHGRSSRQHQAGRQHGLPCRRRPALAILAPRLDHAVQASDLEVAAAMRALFSDTHNVAALAAALQEKARLHGTTVGLALTGGNVDAPVFARTLAPHRAARPRTYRCSNPPTGFV